jgi:hypothetical protein
MLKELFDLVKGEATDTVINNPDVPNQYNNDVVAEATNTVASGLRNLLPAAACKMCYRYSAAIQIKKVCSVIRSYQ